MAGPRVACASYLLDIRRSDTNTGCGASHTREEGIANDVAGVPSSRKHACHIEHTDSTILTDRSAYEVAGGADTRAAQKASFKIFADREHTTLDPGTVSLVAFDSVTSARSYRHDGRSQTFRASRRMKRKIYGNANNSARSPIATEIPSVS